MTKELTWNPARYMRPGDIVLVEQKVYRKWWEIWRPKVLREEHREYVVTTAGTLFGPVRP